MVGRTILIVAFTLFFAFCQKNKKEKLQFARIGGKTISQESFDAFRTMKNGYPASSDGVYPGNRYDQTVCVEAEILFNQAGSFKKVVEGSLDWRWKKDFFPAQQYIESVLDKNWGFTDKEIEKYYKKHRETFKKVIQVPVAAPKKADSAKTENQAQAADKDTASNTDALKSDTTRKDTVTKAVLKDSVYYLSLNESWDQIARTLFLAKYPPDSTFIKANTDSGKAVDSFLITNKWVSQFRKDFPAFYMKLFYKRDFKKEYPDSLSEIYGNDKVITPEDFAVIMNWIPEDSREYYKTEERKRYLIEWLLKWKIFAQESKKYGLEKIPANRHAWEWAFKYETAMRYAKEKLAAGIGENMPVDTQLCYWEVWDRTAQPGIKPDTTSLKNQIKAHVNTKKTTAIDSTIYTLRKKARVTFLQPDYVDNLVKDPVAVAAKADSLYSAGSSNEADEQYRILVESFPFTQQGKNAMVERAKILTEKENYSDAIQHYRKFLLLSGAKDRTCNIFFMVGFIYGEYLAKPELAEASYKWILKNTPDCELVDDAEFMALHLDEPMISIEELQAESKRQGKNIDVKDQLQQQDATESDT